MHQSDYVVFYSTVGVGLKREDGFVDPSEVNLRLSGALHRHVEIGSDRDGVAFLPVSDLIRGGADGRLPTNFETQLIRA